MGIAYNDLLDLDIRKFNCLADGYISRREARINDDLMVGHIIAGKIAAAVWNDRSYKKPIKQIKLREEKNTTESRNERVFRTLKAKGII